MIYNKENRSQFRVTGVKLDIYDDANIITVKSDNQNLESFNVKNKIEAKDIYRTLNTDLASNSRSDKGFWDDYDWFRRKNETTK